MTGPGPLLNAFQMQWDDFFILLRHSEENSGVIFIFKHRLPCSQCWYGCLGSEGLEISMIPVLPVSEAPLNIWFKPTFKNPATFLPSWGILSSSFWTQYRASNEFNYSNTNMPLRRHTVGFLQDRELQSWLLKRFASPSRREPQNPPSITPSLRGY